MSATKKLLVAFDPARPECQTSDVLVPWKRDGLRVFLGLKSGNDAAFKVLVFVGRSITENHFFSKLIEAGCAIANVDQTLESLRSYLVALQALKIGIVARLGANCVQSGPNVELEIVCHTPSAIKPLFLAEKGTRKNKQDSIGW